MGFTGHTRPPPKLYAVANDDHEYQLWRHGLVLPRHAAVRLADMLVLTGRTTPVPVVDLTGGYDQVTGAARLLLAGLDRLVYLGQAYWADRPEQCRIANAWWRGSLAGTSVVA